MANRTDIWNRLQAYEVAPPDAAFSQLMNRLGQEDAASGRAEAIPGAWQGLREFEIEPPAALLGIVAKAAMEKPLFIALQDHVVTPPATLYDRIASQTIDKNQVRVAPVRSLMPRFRAVAAVILLMMGAYTIYNIVSNKATTPAHTSFQDPKQSKQPAKRTPATKPANTNAMARYRLYDNPRTENYFVNDVFVADGSGLPLVDNDFMATFASYEWEDLPAFLYEEEESELTVRLDQYSYFTISENMMNNLRKMYQRKAKGAPTRKAKRELARLEKWKKADEEQFDKKRAGNPLDPVDLAEFIFDY
ncbi:hypothetical protein [Paraflavitalea pollutisoli]|uniref:hypothetical protein n=1 Tax=Paraflavitalea pollutisoli TaxID=3034143 RepID=UPI0023EC0BC5|nr:hypothetical protein [Paraflavitalea sp. H1-2-19X]